MTEKDRSGREKSHNTAFYIETLILVGMFTVVILVLTRMFALSGERSEEARRLTCAVHLAENAAEAVSASDSPQALCELLDEGGNARLTEGVSSRELSSENSLIQVWYDGGMNPAPAGDFETAITWIPEKAENGGDTGLVSGIISVYWKGELIYRLDTAVYRRCTP